MIIFLYQTIKIIMQRSISPTNGHELYLEEKNRIEYEDTILYAIEGVSKYPEISQMNYLWCLMKIHEFSEKHKFTQLSQFMNYCLTTSDEEEAYTCILMIARIIYTLRDDINIDTRSLQEISAELRNEMIYKHRFVRVQWGYIYIDFYREFIENR